MACVKKTWYSAWTMGGYSGKHEPEIGEDHGLVYEVGEGDL